MTSTSESVEAWRPRALKAPADPERHHMPVKVRGGRTPASSCECFGGRLGVGYWTFRFRSKSKWDDNRIRANTVSECTCAVRCNEFPATASILNARCDAAVWDTSETKAMFVKAVDPSGPGRRYRGQYSEHTLSLAAQNDEEKDYRARAACTIRHLTRHVATLLLFKGPKASLKHDGKDVAAEVYR
jgi:hypothetical protein